MPVVLGNGRDVIKINGHAVQYQGIGHIRPDMPTEVAVDKTKHNGLDEYFINVKDEQGKTQRILVYGDRLDFSFRDSRQEPTVTINGRQGKLIAFENDPNSFGRGLIEGAKGSLGEAFDALGNMAKGIIGSSGAGTAAAVAGVAGVSVFGGVALLSSGMHAGLLATLMTAAQPLTLAALGVAAAAMVIVAISGAIKGASAAMLNHPKMETVAAVLGESNDLQAQKPFNPGATPEADRPVPPPVPEPVKPPIFYGDQNPQQPTVSNPVKPPLKMRPVPPADPGLDARAPNDSFQRHHYGKSL